MIMWTSAPRDRQEVDVEVRHGCRAALKRVFLTLSDRRDFELVIGN